MAELHSHDMAVADFCKKLDANERFLFSRYGDGEWGSILEKRKPKETNCDGHRYFTDMGFELREALKSRPDYLVGMQDFALKIYSGIIPWLEQQKLLNLNWVVADVFHRASARGELKPLAESLRRRNLVVVGPDHLRSVATALEAAEFVEVPRKNCYLKLPEIIRATWTAIDRVGQNPVVSVSCGMPAKILIHKLAAAENVTALDMGSVWDVYAGVPSRKYHREMTPQPL